MAAHIRKVVREGGDRFETQHRRKDGVVIDVDISTKLIEIGGEPCFFTFARDITERKREEQTLHRLVEGTSSLTGRPFFERLVRELAGWLGTRWAMVSEIAPEAPGSFRPLAFWNDGSPGETEVYEQRGTPCARALSEGFVTVCADVGTLFPQDAAIADLGVESYVGVALADDAGGALGVLCIFHDRPLTVPTNAREVFSIFAQRTSAEILRTRAEEDLRRRTEELQTFNQAMVGREMRIIELKEEANRLCAELGREAAYRAVWNEGTSAQGDRDREDGSEGAPS